jgi:hypothetical protein
MIYIYIYKYKYKYTPFSTKKNGNTTWYFKKILQVKIRATFIGALAVHLCARYSSLSITIQYLAIQSRAGHRSISVENRFQNPKPHKPTVGVPRPNSDHVLSQFSRLWFNRLSRLHGWVWSVRHIIAQFEFGP